MLLCSLCNAATDTAGVHLARSTQRVRFVCGAGLHGAYPVSACINRVCQQVPERRCAIAHSTSHSQRVGIVFTLAASSDSVVGPASALVRFRPHRRLPLARTSTAAPNQVHMAARCFAWQDSVSWCWTSFLRISCPLPQVARLVLDGPQGRHRDGHLKQLQLIPLLHPSGIAAACGCSSTATGCEHVHRSSDPNKPADYTFARAPFG